MLAKMCHIRNLPLLLNKNAKLYSHFGRQFGSFLQNQAYSYTIQQLCLLGSTQIIKTVHKKTHTRMFTAAVLIIAQMWKQPICPSVGEWINKLWYIQPMEYYSGQKRNELSSQEKPQRKFKGMLLSRRSQSEKAE